MNHQSPSYFNFLELPITHELKEPVPQQPLHEEWVEFMPKRVSQKLLQNRLRKLEIEQKKHREKDLLVEKRVTKEKEIYELFRRRDLRAQERRENHLRPPHQTPFNDKHQDPLSLEQLTKIHRSEAIITKCRQRVQQKKLQYVARIHMRTRERQQKAELRRRVLRENVQKVNDDIHLEEWRQYETQILLKHKDHHSPPDRLYQDYKKKRQVLDNLISPHQKENLDLSGPVQRQSAPHQEIPSSKAILFRSRRVQYFGVHEGDAIKKTEADIVKMRKFIQQHSCAADPNKDDELLGKFQSFLIHDLLAH